MAKRKPPSNLTVRNAKAYNKRLSALDRRVTRLEKNGGFVAAVKLAAIPVLLQKVEALERALAQAKGRYK